MGWCGDSFTWWLRCVGSDGELWLYSGVVFFHLFCVILVWIVSVDVKENVKREWEIWNKMNVSVEDKKEKCLLKGWVLLYLFCWLIDWLNGWVDEWMITLFSVCVVVSYLISHSPFLYIFGCFIHNLKRGEFRFSFSFR